MNADKVWNWVTTVCIGLILLMLYNRFLTEQTSLVKTVHTVIIMGAITLMFLRVLGVMLVLDSVKDGVLQEPISVLYTIIGIFIGAMTLGTIVLSLC